MHNKQTVTAKVTNEIIIFCFTSENLTSFKWNEFSRRYFTCFNFKEKKSCDSKGQTVGSFNNHDLYFYTSLQLVFWHRSGFNGKKQFKEINKSTYFVVGKTKTNACFSMFIDKKKKVCFEGFSVFLLLVSFSSIISQFLIHR